MSALFALQTNQIMLLVGIGLVLFVFVNRLRRSFVPDQRASQYRRPAPSPHRPANTRPGEVIGSARLRSSTASKEQEALEVEMHQLARQFKADIDTKLSALARLIQAADNARLQLQTAIDRAESLGLIDDEPHLISRAASDSVDIRRSPSQRPPDKKRAISSAQLCVAEGDFDKPADDPRFDRVFALADAGFSATRIASQIGSQVGEVELILSLRGAA